MSSVPTTSHGWSAPEPIRTRWSTAAVPVRPPSVAYPTLMCASSAPTFLCTTRSISVKPR